MSPNKSMPKSTLKVKASRARPAKQEVRHSLNTARAQQIRKQNEEKRNEIIVARLIEGAAVRADCARLLADCIELVRAGPDAAILDGWVAPQLVETAVVNSAQPTLSPPLAQARSKGRL